MFDGTDDKGSNNLLINLKCKVIVVEPASPIINMPHYMILVFCEKNVRDY